VQFHEPLRRGPGAAVKTVDVLRHHGERRARAFERHHRVMNRVRLRTLIDLPGLELVVPVLDARGFRGHEVVVVDRAAARPDAVRAAEIGNAARRRHASPGEDQNPVRRAKALD